MPVFSIKREVVRAILEEDRPEASSAKPDARGTDSPVLSDPERLPGDVRAALERAVTAELAFDRQVTHVNLTDVDRLRLGNWCLVRAALCAVGSPGESHAARRTRQLRGAQLQKASEALENPPES